MKFVSWNVNGLRAALGKGFKDVVAAMDADAFCVQETKMQPEQMAHDIDGGYELFWNSAERRGYSGTATATRVKPVAVECGTFDNEGRILTLDLGELYLVNVYSPNSQGELARLPYRLEWEAQFRDYLKRLDAEKPVVVCGDLNVAHCEIDLANPPPTTTTPVSPTRNATPSAAFSTADLSIRSACCIPTTAGPTRGGATACGPASAMWGGVSIIFL